ncbi:thioredoxin family protein [Opitutaceae bacterium TAV4]|uniref:thioredoxin family protein n=1 Tax=Geminisphaera colitermitum TaxID=1148786 RepID=UPI000158DB1C|nr:thioredoxin family protein [Geminisphaera colitermitum]RRJ94552.1 thioredoxin family protein [Opitutaceae bacterium TAV4]RRJ98614.1 thioredoxin family protein [Opitutaceae bacterium TAV3]
MKHLTTLFRTFAATAALVFGSVLLAVEAGQPAPDFTLTDINGQTHTLSALKGKTVVLEWVNPECPFVVKHYEKSGNIPGLQKSAAADGVVWLSINSAAPGKQGDYDKAQIEAWSKKTSAAPAAYLRDTDGKVGKLYGAKTTPHMFVINAEGVLVYHGGIDSIRSANPGDIAKAEPYVVEALAAVKKGETPATTSAAPYGCSVKY